MAPNSNRRFSFTLSPAVKASQ
ncbi:hypothetical protein CSOJ01_13910 [Colletotrichum sojae]|nr:hypothetical protein CSOJ01_13910 [Colletotrichum sojae]